MSPLRWTSKSTRHLAQALSEQDYPVSHETVAQLLRVLGYSLQGTAKTLEGAQHPDRNSQFEYINRLTKQVLQKGWPVISVDTKKKELVGPYHRAGREWQPQGKPEKSLSGILCLRHTMLPDRRQYAEANQEDAEGQRCRASGGVAEDPVAVA